MVTEGWPVWVPIMCSPKYRLPSWPKVTLEYMRSEKVRTGFCTPLGAISTTAGVSWEKAHRVRSGREGQAADLVPGALQVQLALGLQVLVVLDEPARAAVVVGGVVHDGGGHQDVALREGLDRADVLRRVGLARLRRAAARSGRRRVLCRCGSCWLR